MIFGKACRSCRNVCMQPDGLDEVKKAVGMLMEEWDVDFQDVEILSKILQVIQ